MSGEEELWESARDSNGGPVRIPPDCGSWLARSLKNARADASAVRLSMHGSIRLGGWKAFRAIQVISADRGMVWRATVSMGGLPVKGYDRLLDCRGEMRWKMLGLIPLVRESGPDVTRSAAGRMAAEMVWLPQALCRSGVRWSRPEPDLSRARASICGEDLRLDLAEGPGGSLRSLRMRRWGDPDGQGHRYADFGGLVEGETEFDGVVIPSRLRIGWSFDGSGFRGDGEFFRVTIDGAVYR